MDQKIIVGLFVLIFATLAGCGYWISCLYSEAMAPTIEQLHDQAPITHVPGDSAFIG